MPIALIIGMPVASMRPGTIRKPPPMPKKPDAAPAASATAAVARHILRSTGRHSTVTAFRGFSIRAPTTIIRTPNRNIRLSPSLALPRLEPPRAPSAEKTVAHRNPPLPPQISQPKTAGANTRLDKTWGQGQADDEKALILEQAL